MARPVEAVLMYATIVRGAKGKHRVYADMNTQLQASAEFLQINGDELIPVCVVDIYMYVYMVCMISHDTY